MNDMSNALATMGRRTKKQMEDAVAQAVLEQAERQSKPFVLFEGDEPSPEAIATHNANLNAGPEAPEPAEAEGAPESELSEVYADTAEDLGAEYGTANEDEPSEETTEETTEEEPLTGDAAIDASYAEQYSEQASGEEAETVTSQGDNPEDAPPAMGDNNPEALKRKFLRRVRQYGEQSGAGDQSRVSLALDAVRAASDGLIGTDDAEEVYELFQQGKFKKRGEIYEKEGSFKQQVSKIRQVIRVGAELFDDGVDVLQRAYDLRVLAAKNDETRKALKGSTFDFLIDVSRRQNDESQAGVALTDDEIHGIMFPDKKDRTRIDEIKSILKRLEGWRDGKKATDTKEGVPADDNQNLEAMIDYAREYWFDLEPGAREAEAEKAQKLDEANALLAALGRKPIKAR